TEEAQGRHRHREVRDDAERLDRMGRGGLMRRPTLSLVLLLTLTTTTYADTNEKHSDVDEADQVVLVNAASKLGFQGPVAKLKRVFDARGMLRELPEGFEAMFDGR